MFDHALKESKHQTRLAMSKGLVEGGIDASKWVHSQPSTDPLSGSVDPNDTSQADHLNDVRVAYSTFPFFYGYDDSYFAFRDVEGLVTFSCFAKPTAGILRNGEPVLVLTIAAEKYE
ncbi:hypothetical protein VTL71DRAFT_15138 [Oculimacula yallundae]|uniref:Uncharacterized protein n=1 Tax=Oculimacula yallundae TaxID=86028 RepID=A0ABR4CGC1_9HELO